MTFSLSQKKLFFQKLKLIDNVLAKKEGPIFGPWSFFERIYAMLCAIWCDMYNLKNLKNTHGEVTLFHWEYYTFLYCANRTISWNPYVMF